MAKATAPRRAVARKAAPRKAAAVGRPRTGQRLRVTVSDDAPAKFNALLPVGRLVEVIGNNTLAQLLGVSRSQPSRWRSGKEQLSPDNRRRVSDLDHVLDRLLLELYPDEVGMWLTSPNPHLGGARPIDEFTLRGAAGVLPAIDALADGAFA